MEQMRYYPLFLDLSRAVCLVIGAGRVGRRKIAALLECGAAGVVALDPFADAEKLQVFVEDSRFCFERRPFREEDMAGKALVFICTSSREVNRTAAAACRARNVLCNVADAPHEGAFIVPSHVDAPPLSLALSLIHIFRAASRPSPRKNMRGRNSPPRSSLRMMNAGDRAWRDEQGRS